jgi:hypothetical protein
VTPNATSAFASTMFQIGGHNLALSIREKNFSGLLLMFASVEGLGFHAPRFAIQNSGSFPALINFRPGQSILTASGSPSKYGAARFIARTSLSGTMLGRFATGKTGFAGFYFNNGVSGLDFGWLRLKVSDPNSVGYFTEIQALDWAYNDVAFAPIAAAEGPEPGTAALALLASGAAGLLAWRRRRKA